MSSNVNRRWRASAPAHLLALLLPAAAAAHGAAPQPCRLAEDEVRWVQRALANWERGSTRHLRLPPAPAPWIVVFEADPARARELALRGVALIRERRARHFTGDDAIYARIEDLFLNMEGVAEWVRLELHEEAGGFESVQEIAAFMRGRNNNWSQDEGLALILILDRFADGWQSRLLGAGMASPVDELERALRHRP